MILTQWLDETNSIEWYWYAKRLTGNDTGATGAHQGGPLISNEVIFTLMDSFSRDDYISETFFECEIEPYGIKKQLRLVWYKSKGEGRITQWGKSDIFNPKYTGGIFWMAFHTNPDGGIDGAKAFICPDTETEDMIENAMGEVYPRADVLLQPELSFIKSSIPSTDCICDDAPIPESWLADFPKASELVQKAISLVELKNDNYDKCLLDRKDCEFILFRKVQDADLLPKIRKGFNSVESFLSIAQSAIQRRRSRNGMSFEYHLAELFNKSGVPYAFQAVSENRKKPDFLFPSKEAYDTLPKNDPKLRMLGAKTTVKDRWRQVINEANKIDRKHLITLQDCVSEYQYEEMQEEGVILVVPEELQPGYPDSVRSHLISLNRFIGELDELYAGEQYFLFD